MGNDDDDNDDNGEGATSDDDDSDGATGDKVNDDGGGATTTTTMKKAMAQWDRMTTTMAMDINDNDGKGDDASLTMCDEGDNRNRGDSEDSCVSTATTPAHWQRR